MIINPIDYKLIDLLQKNARMTQSEMASAVGLSQPAIAERLRKLEQEGVITAYVARVNARQLGKDITAFIGVGIEHPKYNNRFAKIIREIPDVLECHHVTGSVSYLLKVVTENTETLDRLISERLRIIPGVTRTHTTVVMSSVKESTHIKPAVEDKQQPRKRR
ncbi:MAG TPA: Lrp/AsnC family transcriptional regulator [Blastocatellia bacterium]|jgi:Lrp/AsnC family leucine-responsive transcriptional regulator|nr:Lrp/AsnC family transcriptional regulator [Blastocatellia bacterium]